MIAVRNPHPPGNRAGTVIRLNGGPRILVEDVRTANHGRAILAELDATVSRIEQQLGEAFPSRSDPGWRRRAEQAMAATRRTRDLLALRVESLASRPGAQRRDARRKAFISAAEAMLDRYLFTEIWERAAENEPEAFEGWEGIRA